MKNIVLLVLFAVIVTAAAGCTPEKPEILDGPDMEYRDSDHRTDFANVFDFDSLDTQPMFAVAFLGYGDRMDFRHTYVEGLFSDLGDFAVEQVGHIDYEGDEWYLIVPRYKEDVDITNLDTGEVHTIYNGEAFTVKCNLSDLHPNIEISTEFGLSGHKFSPQMGGDGRLITNADVWDITDYGVLDEIQEGE